MKFNTKAIHGGQKPDKAYGAVMQPIYQTTTYAQTTPGEHKGFGYSRTHNPTRTALEHAFASLENGEYGVAFGSGMAAIDAVLKLLKFGDEVIATNDLYGGTYRLFTMIYESFGIKFHFVGMENIGEIESYINANTKLLWLETPTNPMFSNSDKDINQEIHSKELGSIIEKALLNIPEDYRLVFTLREMNGFNVAETAELLDISESNVKVRLNRAKAMLQNEISKSYVAEELYDFHLRYCNPFTERVMKIIDKL